MACQYDPALDKPGLSSGTPWSEEDDHDIRWAAEHGGSVAGMAVFLCRSRQEICLRMKELSLEGG
jgi:hypothetical protein